MHWVQEKFELAFKYSGLVIARTDDPQYRPPTLTLQAGGDVPHGLASADVTLTFTKGITKIELVLHGCPFDKKKGVFTVSGQDLANQLLIQFATVYGPKVSNPAGTDSAAATLVFKDAAGLELGGKRKATNSLCVAWVESGK